MTELNFDHDILLACSRLGLEIDKRGKTRCPWHDDHDPSLQIYSDTNSCYCFVCHRSGDAVDLAKQMLNLSTKSAIDWLEGAANYRALAPLRRKETIKQPSRKQYSWLDMGLVQDWSEMLKHNTPARDYLAQRGLYDLENLFFAFVGWTGDKAPPEYQNMIAMPYFDSRSDTVLGVKFRSITEKKFRAAGRLTTPYLWYQTIGSGLHRRLRPVFIVEAELDALLINQILGIWAAIATPAGHITAKLALSLSKRPAVALLADADEAGEKAAQTLQDALGNLYISFMPVGKDFGDFFQAEPEEARRNLIDFYMEMNDNICAMF